MANNPINLVVRFFLELVGFYALGYWGWTQHNGLWSILWGIGLPLLAAVMWGSLRVPNDPGKAPIPVPGILRLLLEALFFSAAVWAFYASGRGNWGLILGVVVLLHYLVSYDRIQWLFKQ